MNRTRKSRWMLAAAVAALPLYALAPPAEAQHRVEDGRQLDASNQIGAGGINPTRPDLAPGVTGNEIITGNVTAGREFRDAVPYRDARAFRGETAGVVSDRFVRDSAGAPAPMAPRMDLTTPQPFYGESRAVAPPEGFVRAGFAGGFVHPEPMHRRADTPWAQPIEPPPIVDLPRPGELMLPGPVDPTDQQRLLTASPLMGVRVWQPDSPADQSFLEQHTGLRGRTARDRLGIDDQALQRMREEIEQTIIRDDDASGMDQLQLEMPRPFESPRDEALPGEIARSELADVPLRGGLETDEGLRHRLAVPAVQQSTQHAELQQRLDAYYDQRAETDADAHRRFLAEMRARQEAEAEEARTGFDIDLFDDPEADPEADPGAPETTLERFGIPDFAGRGEEILAELDRERREAEIELPFGTADERPIPVDPPEPLRITSLARGVEAPGLRNLLSAAEELMRDGRFTSALDHYDAAEQVAPNNPLIRLGRANAELGASYYTRADIHLRQAFAADPALLMGQYDLEHFIGRERVEFIVSDLEAIAQAEPEQIRPVFLLAYVAYNTGNPGEAAAYLDMAEQRADERDAMIELLREHWNLPME